MPNKPHTFIATPVITIIAALNIFSLLLPNIGYILKEIYV